MTFRSPATIYRSLKQSLAKRVILDRVPLERTIFLGGAGRSGTTWIAEQLIRRKRVRYMFEPFHSRDVPAWHGRAGHQYMRPDNEDAAVFDGARKIISGQIRGWWPDHFNRTIRPDFRLVKDIRTNLMMGWLHRKFPQVKMAFAVRHPCAVIHSRMSLGWEPLLHVFLDQPRLIEDHLKPFEADLRRASRPLEQHVLRWCIEHYVPLRQLGANTIPIYFYEDFCIEPEKWFSAMADHYGLPRQPGEFEEASKKPSRLVRPTSAVLSEQSGFALTQSWRKHFNAEEVELVFRTLRMFGLHELYNEEGLPADNAIAKTVEIVRGPVAVRAV